VGSINHSQAIRPDTAYLRKIIESSLLADWAISIEYQSNEAGISGWQRWDKAFFAIRSAKPVLEALIRISAEKFRPHTRMIYTVYNPRYLPAETEAEAHTSTRQSAREHDQTPAQNRMNVS